MSAAILLTELEAVGVPLSLADEDLRYETRPGVSIAPYRDSIRASKPALLAVLRAREDPAAMGLTPNLRWVHVDTGPVAASRPPHGWDRQVPAGCGVPYVCRSLGPCPHFTTHGRCWKDEVTT
jgi:hypothetical protein